MQGQLLNRFSGKFLLVLSLIALLAVATGYLGPRQAEQDEGTAAHIFQLSMVLLVPAGLLFLATADWKTPLLSVRPLAFPAVAVALALLALHYLEHWWLRPVR